MMRIHIYIYICMCICILYLFSCLFIHVLYVCTQDASLCLYCHFFVLAGPRLVAARLWRFKIHQRGVQWKKGVVICMLLCAMLLCNTTPIHCTPLRPHPPLMNTQPRTCCDNINTIIIQHSYSE